MNEQGARQPVRIRAERAEIVVASAGANFDTDGSDRGTRRAAQPYPDFAPAPTLVDEMAGGQRAADAGIFGSARSIVDGGAVAVLWAFILVAAVLFAGSMSRDRRTRQKDFAVYYFLAQAMREHRNPYAIDIGKLARANGADIHDISRGTEPPTFLLLFEPLAGLSLRNAYWAWQAINVVCLGISLFLLLGVDSKPDPMLAATIAGLAMLYPPVGLHLWMGQSKLPLLLLLVLAMHWMERRREMAAGAALALAALLRVFPIALVGYLALQHRWRVAAYTIVGVLLGCALTVMFTGIADARSFVSSLSFLTGNWWESDIGLRSFVARTLWALYPTPLLTAQIARFAIVGIVDLTVVTMTVGATLVFEEKSDPGWRVFSLWVATSIFLLPVAWDYDLTLMLIPFVQLARAAARGEASRRAVLMAAGSYVLILLWECVIGHVPPSATVLRATIGEGGFFSMLTAYVAAYWFAVDARGATARPIVRPAAVSASA